MRLSLALALPLLAAPLLAQEARLESVDRLVDRWVESERVAGVVAIVEQQGETLYERVDGMLDLDQQTPMRRDAIFRIYSMTKPVTCVAALILCDEGVLDLDDPVAKHLPQLADVEVAIEEENDAGETVLRRVPAERPMTVRDLMRHTSGFTYGLFGTSAIERLVMQSRVLDPGHDLERMVEIAAELPLKHQPGTTFEYGISIDVLGRVIEVVAEQPLDEFMQQRIFEPLGMVDTGFSVASDQVDRIATVYQMARGELQPFASPGMLTPAVKPKLLSGGGGLFSTAADYLRFCRMLLGDGALGEVRILRPETVAEMRTNQLDGQRLSGVAATAARDGFGLGGAVNSRARPQSSGVGTYTWAGAAGTAFWVDPENDLIGVMMIQNWMELAYAGTFQQAVYRAMHQ